MTTVTYNISHGIRDRAHAEALTRDAAAAIGKDVTTWVWLSIEGGLVPPTAVIRPLGIRPDSFAPLNDPADAYMIENMLQMSARYTAGIDSTVLHLSTDIEPVNVMCSIREGDDALRKRMECATKLASMIAQCRNLSVEQRRG